MFITLRKSRSGGFSISGIAPSEIISLLTLQGTHRSLWSYLANRINMLDDIELKHATNEAKRAQQTKPRPSNPKRH